jgi:ATP phosphoribosyltransferase
MITIALPKGRVANDTLAIFSKIFGSDFVFEDRKLILETENFTFLQVRNQDVPVYVERGACDMGVVGYDVLLETGARVCEMLDLGIGKCRISIATKDGVGLDLSKGYIRVATKMQNIAKDFFASKAMAVDIVKLYGSIELAPLVGLADCIVDIVETGETLRQNGLVEVCPIMTSSVRLIANENSLTTKRADVLDITSKLKLQLGA